MAGAVPVLTHHSGMGDQELLWEQNHPWLEQDTGDTEPTEPTSSCRPLPLSKHRLLFVNELPQSLLSSVLTRKRAWGLLMEKSLSLSALQCGYSYKENRIPCGIWGGGREKEQKL